MIWLLVLLVVPYAMAARMVAGHVAHEEAAKYPSQGGVPDGRDWGDGVSVGMFWPVYFLVVAGLALWALLMRATPVVGAERTHQREAERRRMLEAVRRGERELGIGDKE